MKSHRTTILLAVLATLLLSGCGVTPGFAAGIQGEPIRLHAKMFGFGGGAPLHDVMIEHPVVVRTLLEMIRGMQPIPKNQPCTLQGGPHYELTFLAAGSGVVLAVTADASGCGTVTFGKQDERLADKNFWPLLNQAIVDGAAQGQFDHLAVVHSMTSDGRPISAMLTSTAKLQLLYAALKQLPEARTDRMCQDDLPLDYKLAFQKNGQSTRIQLSRECNVVFLYDTGSIILSANPVFWRLLDQTLTGATWNTAQPDTLNLTAHTSDAYETFSSEFIPRAPMLNLYNSIYHLLPVRPEEHCPTSAALPTYTMGFSWQSISLLNVYASPSECATGTVTLAGTFVPIKWHANPAFWNMLQQIIKQF